jgi:hypothetical protein
VVSFVVLVVLFIMVANFSRFHLLLVLHNNTTLEKMDAERTKAPVTTEVGL